jgi:CRP/FNR family transcriptional regulator
MNSRDALRNALLLKTLPDEALNTLAQAGCVRRLHRYETLFLESDRCLGLIVVLSGAIKVYKLDSRGRELTLDLEMPGESVGELPLFDGGNYPANAEAVEDGTTVLIVPREVVRNVMAQYPALAEQALKALGVRMRKLMQRLESQALHTVRARLANYLLQAGQGRDRFLLTETNEAIGNQIGTVRDVVSRTLRILADSGAITLNGRQVTVRDPALLQQIAGSSDTD